MIVVVLIADIQSIKNKENGILVQICSVLGECKKEKDPEKIRKTNRCLLKGLHQGYRRKLFQNSLSKPKHMVNDVQVLSANEPLEGIEPPEVDPKLPASKQLFNCIGLKTDALKNYFDESHWFTQSEISCLKPCTRPNGKRRCGRCWKRKFERPNDAYSSYCKRESCEAYSEKRFATKIEVK